jgi:exodeoxyribonuclease V gamma subunit
MQLKPLPTPGLIILHSHRLELLRDVLIGWMQTQPVAPLGREEILVQSNGIAQWLKMGMALSPDGIAAGLKVELPNQFVWQLYRAALGNQVPTSLPYDKHNLAWRLLRLLPALENPVFEPLNHYRKQDPDGRKSWHLAMRLADLFDQYQVYRADWLQAWNEANDVMIRHSGAQEPLSDDDRWQAALWRQLRQDLADHAAPTQYSSRADIHNLALEKITSGSWAEPHLLPDRVLVFGISSLPRQTLELLSALGQHRQVILAVLNPCRHYWGDITSIKEEVRRQQRRQQRKPGIPVTLDPEQLHLYAPPLLASWGKLGRDYLSLLDSIDHTESCKGWFQGRIDLFDEEHPAAPSLLHRLQTDILELNPSTQDELPDHDHSLSFHIAHSRQREVEILQDQLISAFQADPDLRVRDIIVMVPDIGDYAAHIHAVFGRIEPSDPRYLPYSIADQQLRGHDPLLIALEFLLNLPQSRVTLNELMELLEVPAIALRFGLDSAQLPLLRHWLSEAGVRWGLDRNHRDYLQLGAAGDAYTWMNGLMRLLLGYALGESERWQGVLAYPHIGGLAAAELGPVITLVRQLLTWYARLNTTRTIPDWVAAMSGEQGLLNTFFTFQDDAELRLQQRLMEGLLEVRQAAAAGQFQGAVGLGIWRDAWMETVDQAGLSQRFLAGSLTFSTLLPMRAIPFRRIYLLGMGDQDYPRNRRLDDFDLLVKDYRPGDRSRRDDDRYLFLEALLSARDSLSISWVGRQARDNSKLPPSILVSQLQDVVNERFYTVSGHPASQQLTQEYPLQPFSVQYFCGDRQTWAHEWERPQSSETHLPGYASGLTPAPHGTLQAVPNPIQPGIQSQPLTLWHLEDFCQNPIRHYLHQRLQIRLRKQDDWLQDQEPFSINALESYVLTQNLLDRWLTERNPNFNAWTHDLKDANRLPLGVTGNLLRHELSRKAISITERVNAKFPQLEPAATIDLKLEFEDKMITDRLTGLFEIPDQTDQAFLQLQIRPGAIKDKGQPRLHTCLRTWIRQLAANAAGYPVSTWLFGLDTEMYLPALSQHQAQHELTSLLHCYRLGLKEPLPVLLKTALAWLSKPDINSTRLVYEGNSQARIQPESGPECLRYYPDFDALFRAGFSDWAERLYRPLQAAQWQLDH